MDSLDLGSDHKPFIKVPVGGSCCANCIFLSEDKRRCTNKYFIKWYGKNLLPKEIDEYCSDWYEPNPDYLAKGGVVTVKAPYYFRKEKKKEHAQILANSIRALRSQITKDLKSDDEKTRLTALVIAIIDNTAERVGNEVSEEDGHFGVTGLRKKHVTISGNKITLKYTGKSGVEHEKSFSDALIAENLKEAIKNTPRRSIFVTSDGFRIKGDRVNRYLQDFKITAKDLRGYHANNFIIEQLKKSEIPESENDRKKLFKKAVVYSASKVGHKALTLQKHYLIEDVRIFYIEKSEIINLKDFYMNNTNKKDDKFNEIADYLKNKVESYGFVIRKGVESETDYGTSWYFKVYRIEPKINNYGRFENDFDPRYDEKKIRISDHVSTNRNRMSEEIQISSLGDMSVIKASIDKKISALKSLWSNNMGKDGGILEGKKHTEGGIKAIVTDINKPVELESGEAIINAKSMGMDAEFVAMGTPSEIASAINEVGGGVKFDDGAEIEKIPGGLAGGRPDSDFNVDSLLKGIKVEMEHTNDIDIAKEIAKDHLTEDKDYYEKLALMENNNKKIWQQTFSEYSEGLSEDRKKLAKHTHNEQVRAAIKKHKYADAVVSGKMTSNQALMIIKSSDIPIPSEISNLAAVESHERAEAHAKELEELKKETNIKAKPFTKVYTKKDIEDTLEGLKVLYLSSEGTEKENLKNTIEGLEITLETMGDKLEKGGYVLYKDGEIIHETYN